MPHVYVLRCADNSYYVGSTKNLDLRVEQHNLGKGSKYTSPRTPVELLFAQEFDDIADAYAAEKRIQGWSRAKREALIRGQYTRLPQHSARRQRYQPGGADGS